MAVGAFGCSVFFFASDENLSVQSFINTLTRVCIDAIDGNALYTGDQLTSGRVILSPNDVSLWGVDGGSFGGNCNFCSFGAGSGSAGFSAEFQKDTVAASYDVLLKFKAFFLGVSRTDCASPAGDLLFGDHNGDNYLDMSDAFSLLRNEFLGGPPHVAGEGCTTINTCPDVCSP